MAGSVLEQLECREVAALVRLEELRAEVFAAADRLDAAAGELSALVIARRTVSEMLGDQDAAAGLEESGLGEMAVAGRGPGVRGAVRDEAVYERIRGVFTRLGRP